MKTIDYLNISDSNNNNKIILYMVSNKFIYSNFPVMKVERNLNLMSTNWCGLPSGFLVRSGDVSDGDGGGDGR